MRVGYFTAYYPATSHTFIRREIRALEAQGVTIIRYALRADPQGLVEPEDVVEEKRTRFIFKVGAGELFKCVVSRLVKQPTAIIRIFHLALKIGYRSDRGILRHFAYGVEAIVLASWCQRDKIQHLHAHFGTNPAVVALLTHELSGIPFSFTAHGSEEFEKASSLSLDVKLCRAAFAVCVSSFGRSQLMRWSPPELWPKIALVRCGVDSAYLEAQLQPPPDTPRLVCVGRIGEHKGQLMLVAAARHLRAAGIKFEIVFVGDGPMRRIVEEAIHRDGLEQQISITGWVPGQRVKSEILASRALVLPSFSENMPVVIMESMALGRPVISTYIAGIPELVRPGQTGWLVPASDEIALAEAMREALVASIDQLATMGAAARTRVIERHDASREATKLKKLFEGNGSISDPIGFGESEIRQC
jgi:glycosyltransferase involved in cell wall biosynthesis